MPRQGKAGNQLSRDFDIAYKKWLKRRGFKDYSFKEGFNYGKQQEKKSE